MLGHVREVRAECTLHGQRVRLSDVVVSPEDVPPFRVNLGGYWPDRGVDSVIMTLPDSEWGSAKLRVKSAIAFEGTLAESVASVVVPCDALAFGTEQFTPGTYFDDEGPAGPPSWWQLRRASSRLVLRSQPSWEAPRAVLARGPLQAESEFSLNFWPNEMAG